MRKRRILLAEFVARMEDTRLPKCMAFGGLVRGAGCVGGQEKEWMRGLLDDLRAFGINADHWTTAVRRDEEECHKTAEKGAERLFHDEIDRCRESQGWSTACSSVPKRDGKDQGEDSSKQACSCCLARHR